MECALTRFVDRSLFDERDCAYRTVFWPVDCAKRRQWPWRLLSVTVGWLWMAPVFMLVVTPLALIALVGAVWDMTSDDL